MYNVIATEDGVIEPFRLLAQGADLKWQNSEDEMKTAIHCAVIFDKLTCLEMLIQNGGSIFCKETRDWTPMVCLRDYYIYFCCSTHYRYHCSIMQHIITESHVL